MQLQSLSRSITGLCRRPRRWTPALARRHASLTASAASAHPNRHLDRLPRFLCTTCCGKEMRNKPTKEVTGNNNPAIYFASILPNSSHRDGAIYKNKQFMEGGWFDADITDRNETRLEPMRFSKPTQNFNFPRNMLQFFSLTLAECSLSNDSIQLYGYIAARDDNDQMLNYVLKHSRDDPVIAHKGSLIQMTGPKRGIELVSPVLIEFDIRIKNGEREEDDGQLVDGAITCNDRRAWKPVKRRIKGNCSAVDISMACVENALEATIEVVISEVRSGFSLSLRSCVCVLEDEYEEIQLFHGATDRPCGLGRFVLAVTWGDVMVLKFKLGGDNGVEQRRSFRAQVLGCSSRRIKHELANILVKVTWSTI